MNEDWKLLRRMHWKHKGIMICLSGLSFIMCWFAFGSLLLVIKGVLFSMILLVASYFDIRTRIIPDWIHILILLVGLIDFNLIRSLSGILLAPLPFLIMALMQEGSIGGGDVKLVGGIGCCYGCFYCMKISIFSIIFALVCSLVYYLMNREKGSLGFPFIPYFWMGWMVSGMI